MISSATQKRFVEGGVGTSAGWATSIPKKRIVRCGEIMLEQHCLVSRLRCCIPWVTYTKHSRESLLWLRH